MRPMSLAVFCGLVGFGIALCGCAAPRQTFVSPRPGDEIMQTELPKELTDFDFAQRDVPPAQEMPSKECVEPSVWSKWMGAWSGENSTPEKTEAKQRIPLPRTDRETREGESQANPMPPSSVHGF